MPVSRILRFLTLLAVLLAPLTMIHGPAMAGVRAEQESAAVDHGAGAAPAHHQPKLADHCPDRRDGSDEGPGLALDCTIVCAALPAIADRLPERPAAPTLLAPPLLAASLHGLAPEAATPPPRCA